MEHPLLRVRPRGLYVPNVQNQRAGPQRDPRATPRRTMAVVLWSVFTLHIATELIFIVSTCPPVHLSTSLSRSPE